MTEQDKWKPDPKLGGAHIEARRLEVVGQIKKAISVGYYHIDQQLEIDIEVLRKKASEQKSKMMQTLKKAETLPAMTTVRKYWQQNDDEVLHHITETIMRG